MYQQQIDNFRLAGSAGKYCVHAGWNKERLQKGMKTKKKGNNWTAYYDPDTKRYFAEIMYTSREGREQYDYEITQDGYFQLYG